MPDKRTQLEFPVSLAEAMNPWSNPQDTLLALPWFLSRLNAVASNMDSTELEPYAAFKALGFQSETALLAFAARTRGFPLFRRGTRWVIDTRLYDRWHGAQMERLKKLVAGRPAPPPDQAASLF